MTEKEPATMAQVRYAKVLGVQDPERYDKQTLRGLIDVAKGESEQNTKPKYEDMQEPVKVERPYDNVPKKPAQHTTMYVSYAKDIFVKLVPDEGQSLSAMMDEAIALVKQAKEAFE